MHNKKMLSVLLAALMITTSSVTAMAHDISYSSRDKEKECSRNYEGIKKDNIRYTYPNVSELLKKASYNVITLTAKKDAPKETIKPETSKTDSNGLSKASVSEALKNAMAQAQENKASLDEMKILKDQIKAEYETQKAIEKANKELLDKAISKQKQVRGYIAKVAAGKLTYTDEQLAKIDVLSVKLQADVQTVIDKSAAIKSAKEAVKASMITKDYKTALEKLKLETAVRQERGPALTEVNTDLDGILAILAEGQAVLPTETVEQ